MLVFCGCLNGGLGWIGEETTSQTQKDLGSNDSRLRAFGRATAEVYNQPIGRHEHAGAEDDEVFQPPETVDDDPSDHSADQAEERVERLNSGRRRYGEVKGNN